MSVNLSRKRRAWVAQFKPKSLKGSPLAPNAALEEKYAARLARLAGLKAFPGT